MIGLLELLAVVSAGFGVLYLISAIREHGYLKYTQVGNETPYYQGQAVIYFLLATVFLLFALLFHFEPL